MAYYYDVDVDEEIHVEEAEVADNFQDQQEQPVAAQLVAGGDPWVPGTPHPARVWDRERRVLARWPVAASLPPRPFRWSPRGGHAVPGGSQARGNGRLTERNPRTSKTFAGSIHKAFQKLTKFVERFVNLPTSLQQAAMKTNDGCHRRGKRGDSLFGVKNILHSRGGVSQQRLLFFVDCLSKVIFKAQKWPFKKE